MNRTLGGFLARSKTLRGKAHPLHCLRGLLTTALHAISRRRRIAHLDLVSLLRPQTADVAAVPYATVFIRAWSKWRLSHNDVYLDAVTLEVDGAAPGGDYVTRRELVGALRSVASTLER